MNSIHNNPFRIAGLLGNSSERELQRQKAKIKSFTSVGKEVRSEYDFTFLNKIMRDSTTIEKAFSDIEQNQNKINNALFWFINVSPIDNTAIQHLISGNKDKAIEIWEKLVTDKEVNAKNFSAFNNIGTLYFLDGSRESISKGFAVKSKLISSDSFTDFVHTVADATYSPNAQRQTEYLVDHIFAEKKNSLTNNELLSVFSSNPNAKKYASQKVIQEPIRKIEFEIEKAKKSREKNKLNACKAGNSLHTNTKSVLSLLRSVLGKTDLQYKLLADNVAKEMLQCSIDYFNESQEQDRPGNYLQEAMNLALDAKKIAVSTSVTERASENIATLEGMKDRELDQVLEFLEMVKNLYKENEAKIRREVAELELEPFTRINTSAVDYNIRNSINWSAVNDALKDLCSKDSLSKIKNSSKTKEKGDFLDHLRWIQSITTSCTRIPFILRDYADIPPNLQFTVLSSSVVNTDDQPLFTKYIRYISLRLIISAKGSQNIQFHLKYINPDGTVDANTETSPANYSFTSEHSITKETQILNLTGWGSDEKCTYQLGKHKIEVYVDEYLVHKTEFLVEEAPSDKIKKQISECENELSRLQSSEYFVEEIKSAKNKIEELDKFKLFRSSSKKQMQISEQKQIIEDYKKRAANIKESSIKTQKDKIKKLYHQLSITTH